MGDRRSMAGFEVTVRGDRSTESREFCKGEGESDSDLATPLPGLLTLGVAGDALLGVSDKADLDLVDMVGGCVKLLAIEEEKVRQKCVLGWILKGELEC